VKTRDGTKIYRVVALRDFGDLEKGQKGGYVEGEHNLFPKHFVADSEIKNFKATAIWVSGRDWRSSPLPCFSAPIVQLCTIARMHICNQALNAFFALSLE